MLRALGAELSRPTMDIDLLGKTSNSHTHLHRMIDECSAIAVSDGIVFDTTDITLRNIVEGADYHGVRIRFIARLGPTRIPMQIDIGFGDTVVPAPVWIDLPEILDFGVVISFLAAFLLPILNAVANDEESSLTWPPSGPWS